MKIKLENILPKKACEQTKLFIGEVLTKLNTNDLIEGCDLGGLRMLSVNYELYIQASDILIAEGPIIKTRKGTYEANPANRLVTSYAASVFALLKEFGLTVKSRDLIKSMNPEVSDDNPLATFIAKSNG